MHNAEEKIIADKINGLDSLPEGYAPNLDSKFELMNAGRYERKKRKNMGWYFSRAAAAAVFLLLAGGYWLKQSGPSVAPPVAAPGNDAIVKQTTTLPSSVTATSTGAGTSSYINKLTRQSPITNHRFPITNTQPPTTNSQPQITTPQSPTVDSVNSEPVQVAAVQQPATTIKRRYTQVDFNDNISNDKLSNKTWSATGSRIKFGPFGKDNNTSKENVQKEEASLHLKYNF